MLSFSLYLQCLTLPLFSALYSHVSGWPRLLLLLRPMLVEKDFAHVRLDCIEQQSAAASKQTLGQTALPLFPSPVALYDAGRHRRPARRANASNNSSSSQSDRGPQHQQQQQKSGNNFAIDCRTSPVVILSERRQWKTADSASDQLTLCLSSHVTRHSTQCTQPPAKEGRQQRQRTTTTTLLLQPLMAVDIGRHILSLTRRRRPSPEAAAARQ